jgi:uncharacterized protein YbjQ (UPF0145 family)
MPLFRRESPEERQQKEAAQAAAAQQAQIQARSLQALQAGGLPIRAQERIAQIRAGAGQPSPFSSDLSVDELLLIRQTGYEPIGLVAGSSVYHIGWNRWTYTGELDAQTRALYDAVRLALDRLRQEAQGIGAVGVVGVRLELKRPAWGESLVEVIVLGTALRARGAGPAAEPFLSGLSAQEFWSLLRAGCRPVGLAFGNSTYYVYTNWRASQQNWSWYNQEVERYSQGLREAQAAAFGRMHATGASLQATGIVGVHIAHTLHRLPYDDDDALDDYVVEYISWGTAIREAPTDPRIDRPAMVLDLEDARRTPRITLGSVSVVPVAGAEPPATAQPERGGVVEGAGGLLEVGATLGEIFDSFS